MKNSEAKPIPPAGPTLFVDRSRTLSDFLIAKTSQHPK
jgi:hypothetical protein